MEHIAPDFIPRPGARRALLVVKDRRLASRLRSAFNLAGCEVDTRPKVSPADNFHSYHVVLIDTLASREENCWERLRGLPAKARETRLALLVEAQESPLAEQARQHGFHLVRKHPASEAALTELVYAALGEQPARAPTRAPVIGDYEFSLDESRRVSRQAHRQTAVEAVPVAVDFDFLADKSRRGVTRATRAAGLDEAVPVDADLRFMSKPTAIAGKRRSPFLLAGVSVHALALLVALVIPLWYPEVLETGELTSAFLAAPSPPPAPPPPPAAPRAAAPRRRPAVQQLEARVTLPKTLPKKVMIVSDPPQTDLASLAGDLGVVGGVPGGVPGAPGGVIGGVLGGAASVPPPPPRQPQAARRPVRVGGAIRRPRRVNYVEPIYPPLARRARISGAVCIDAVIDASGRIVEAKILHGHPVLTRAAMDAVRRWVYEPTYVGGHAVPIAVAIRVRFNEKPGTARSEASNIQQARGGDLCQQQPAG